MTYRLAIGILAYNEEASIGKTIRSLFKQSYFADLPSEAAGVEVVCVPNGCTDGTASVARAEFEQIQLTGLNSRVRTSVVELGLGSKTHAWNEFVHNLADSAADYFIVMDGDIRIEHPDTIQNVLEALERNPAAFLSAPRALKHVEMRPRRTLLEWLSLQMGAVNAGRISGFAGCMYCARGDLLRRIWFPHGMIGEDAFLHGLVVTDLCRSPEHYERVVGAPNATVVFEAYTTVRKMYRVLRRQAVTRGTNAILWDYLWKNTGPDLDAGELIRRQNEADPGWYHSLVAEHVRRSRWWVMPNGVILRRWGYLRRLPVVRRLSMMPWVVLGMMVDAVVSLDANRLIRKGRIGGLWEATRTTQI